ncbi:CDGSH iron-sulfur domain-containing protein [Streptomyces sp. E-08]|uniref:CDGSH iron-sulfur domain-containing protein n=1 Tax=Streptomyces sp. E-08 TaxID=3404047 RepID=UPI003CF03438
MDDGTTARSDHFMVAVCTCRRSRTYPWCDTSRRPRAHDPGTRGQERAVTAPAHTTHPAPVAPTAPALVEGRGPLSRAVADALRSRRLSTLTTARSRRGGTAWWARSPRGTSPTPGLTRSPTSAQRRPATKRG